MTFRTEIGTPIPEWDAAEKKTRRTLLWLLMALVVFLILFGCGTCSTIATNPEMTNIAIASELEADYGYWRKVSFSAVNPAIIVEAAKDGFNLNRMDTGPSVGCFIPGEDCVTPTADPTTTPPVPTNTPVEEISPMATMTSISSPQVVWVPPTEEASSGSGSAGDTGPPPAPTATPTNTNTPVDTDTPPPPPPPEDTATPEPPTATPTMEFNMIAPGPQVNTGEPDGSYMNVGQGNAFYLDISGNPIILEETPNPDPDFVYYERENGNSNQVLLDWVVLQIAQDLSDTWHIVFYWGDQIPDANTNIDAYATDGDGELDNEPLPMETPASPLVGTPDLNTGITIDVDSKVATPGVYPWLMVGAPSGSGDPAEVDAIQVLPTATP